MRQIHFPVIALFCVLATCVQASNHGENYDMVISSNDVNIAITHMKRLKKLIYMLSDPKFDIRDSTQTKDLERVFEYIGKAYNLNPSEMKRAERGLKDLIEKLKDFFENIFNKKKDKGKGKADQGMGKDDQGMGKKAAPKAPGSDNDDDSIPKKIKMFIEAITEEFKKIFGGSEIKEKVKEKKQDDGGEENDNEEE